MAPVKQRVTASSRSRYLGRLVQVIQSFVRFPWVVIFAKMVGLVGDLCAFVIKRGSTGQVKPVKPGRVT